MELSFDLYGLEKYHSKSQIARITTEKWVKENAFCPACGFASLLKLENNSPVADFCCSDCKIEYELKSKLGFWSSKIVDGAYEKVIERIYSDNNPSLLLLNYSESYRVTDFIAIPGYFFSESIIEKRKALSINARRAGWIGCNILYHQIPIDGQVSIVKEGVEIEKSIAIKNWKKTSFVKKIEIDKRGWVFDVLGVLARIQNVEFSLKDIYKFENELHEKHSENNNIKDKIRQQLQILRDKGYIKFLGQGNYRKL